MSNCIECFPFYSKLYIIIKTAFLLALASAKRCSEIHALAMDSHHLRFNQSDGSVSLIVQTGFLAKNQLPSVKPDPIIIPSLALCCFVVYSTRRFVLCLTLCHFVLVFFGPFSIAITSLGEERANLSAFRTYVLVWICRFPLPLGVWEGLRFVSVVLPGLFSYLFCRISSLDIAISLYGGFSAMVLIISPSIKQFI